MISGSVQLRSIKLQSQDEHRHIVSSLNMLDTIPMENESSTVDFLIFDRKRLLFRYHIISENGNLTGTVSVSIYTWLDTNGSYK